MRMDFGTVTFSVPKMLSLACIIIKYKENMCGNTTSGYVSFCREFYLGICVGGWNIYIPALVHSTSKEGRGGGGGGVERKKTKKT